MKRILTYTTLLVLAFIFLAPFLWMIVSSFKPQADIFASTMPLQWEAFWVSKPTLEHYAKVFNAVPFARYLLNTLFVAVTVTFGHLLVASLAAFAFARFPIPGKNLLFMLVLIQLFVFPEVLIVENYRIASELGLINTITGIGLPYVASAFGIFLLRQTFKTIPRELEDAARIEGCGWLEILWKVYVPLAKPTYLAYGLVSISHHWNNFLWPLVVTNSVESRPLTVGLGVFSAPETGVNWATVSAATLLSIAPLLVAFLLFQRQFVQSFLRAGIR